MAAGQIVAETLLAMADALEGRVKAESFKIGLTLLPNEVGVSELLDGAVAAARSNPLLEPVLIGPEMTELDKTDAGIITHIKTGSAANSIHQAMEQLLQNREIDAAVTMHYNFPLGTATVGRVTTPGRGREIFLATTTGTSATDRVQALVKNALAGLTCARACGIARPRLGILNIEGARACERVLKSLKANGYSFEFARSVRADGGALMRGNDLLAGNCDVLLCDSLTGNILMKVLSAFTTGGKYEAQGCGYGPGLGATFERLVLIISRASGAPVVAGALRYAAELLAGKVLAVYRRELEQAQKAGLTELLTAAKGEKEVAVSPPAAKAVSAEIGGVDILELETAVRCLWQAGIYAASGMGCTGPVILVASGDKEQARNILKQEGYL
ncbi:MAG: glycine reductase [Clostridia bacterium]|nr:glycine reductase [Clostridia bacterium]